MSRSRLVSSLLFAVLSASSLAQETLKPEMSPRPRELTDTERAVMQSSDFLRRLAESYVADRDIEPKVDPAEREGLTQAMQLIATEKLDEALEALKALAKPESSAVFDFTIGTLIAPDELDGDPVDVTRALERHTVHALANDENACFGRHL